MSDHLDDKQREAFEAILRAHQDRLTVVVRAGAGSGKTETITQACRSIGQQYGFKGILCISHTNASVHVFRNRLNVDENITHTIHSLANNSTKSIKTIESYSDEGLDFDSMLDDFISVLKNPNIPLSFYDILQDVQLIIIDEFQDTAAKQFEIVCLLRQKLSCGLVTVCDLAQGIFGFQGADVNNAISLQNEPGTLNLELPNNYRSDHRIVWHANRLGTNYIPIDGLVWMEPMRFRNSSTKASYPLQYQCFDKDEFMYKAAMEWILSKRQEGLLFSGDKLTIRQKNNKWFCYDYANREFELLSSDEIEENIDFEMLENGQEIELFDIESFANEEINLRLNAKPSINGIIINRRPRLLLSTYEINSDRASVFSCVLNTLMLEPEHRCSDDIFFTSAQNRELSHAELSEAMKKGICFLTIHGAKGGEWDSQLHFDWGEDLRYAKQDAHFDQKETHNKLYTAHTRPIDHLMHFVAQWKYRSRDSYPATISRYITPPVLSYFQCANYHGGTKVRHFEYIPSSPNEQRIKGISVRSVAEETSVAHKFEVYTDKEIIYHNTEHHKQLPSSLKPKFNEVNGILLESLQLWCVHEKQTKYELQLLLNTINHRYFVNADFAKAMCFVWKEASMEEKSLLFDLFECEVKRLNYPNPDQPTFQETFFNLFDYYNDSTVQRPSLEKVRSGLHNARDQSIVLKKDLDLCPVRSYIKHFDHNSSDHWSLSSPNLKHIKEKIIRACKLVERNMGNAELQDKFLCVLFCSRCIKFDEQSMDITSSKESEWTTFIQIMTDKTNILQKYLEYLECILPDLTEDALQIHKFVNVNHYQTCTRKTISFIREEEEFEYHMIGFADATGDNCVLEVKSRENNAKMAIQQGFIYSASFGKEYVYNYYVESRKLVRRRRCMNGDHFLIETFKEYISQKGLPNQREPLFQDEVEQYTIKVSSSDMDLS